MKTLTTIISVVCITMVLSVNAQSTDLKGPAYKNAKVSEKYQGNSVILVDRNPGELKGPEAKNHKPAPMNETAIYTASADKAVAPGDSKYKAVDLNKTSAKATKRNLKGPKFKNSRPGNRF